MAFNQFTSIQTYRMIDKRAKEQVNLVAKSIFQPKHHKGAS